MFKVIILYLSILTISIWGIIVFIKKMIKNIRIDKNIVKLTKLASIMVFFALVLFIMAFPFILAFELTEWSKAHDKRIKENEIFYAIPDGAEYNEARYTWGNLDEITKENIDFELLNKHYKGRHEYCVWIDNINPGIVYLKIFALKDGKEISLSEGAGIEVKNNTGKILRFGPNEFSVYDISGIRSYLATVELWYKPFNEDSEEKLLEKIYEVGGFNSFF